MEDSDVLAGIPGEIIGIAAQSLQEAASSADSFRDASVRLADGRTVLITFRRLSHQRGRTRHWFWSAIRAVPADAAGGEVPAG